MPIKHNFLPATCTSRKGGEYVIPGPWAVQDFDNVSKIMTKITTISPVNWLQLKPRLSKLSGQAC